MTRYFINCTATSPEEAHDSASKHGRVRSVKLHSAQQPGWVYGIAEFEPIEEETDASTDS